MQQGIQLEQNQEIPSVFRVFPNPANDFIKIEYYLNEEENAVFVLNNSTGQQLLSKDLNNSLIETTISTSEIKNGVYYYTIHVNNSKQESDKIVIIH